MHILRRGYCSLLHGWIIRAIDSRSQKSRWLLETQENTLFDRQSSKWLGLLSSPFSSTSSLFLFPYIYFLRHLYLSFFFLPRILVTNHAFCVIVYARALNLSLHICLYIWKRILKIHVWRSIFTNINTLHIYISNEYYTSLYRDETPY